MDDLLQEFIAETRETLEAISGEIVGWEADPTDRPRLDAIFRFVHTIKGSCGFLDLPRLARLSHAAEDVLSAVRGGERAPDPQLVSAILAVIDRIGEIVEAIASGEALDDSGEDLLVAALQPAAPETPGDAVAPAMFDVQGLGGASGNAGAGARGVKRSVRLSVDLLDRMMSGVSDMVLARNQLARHVRTADDPQLDALIERLSVSVGELRDTVTRTRMQRIEALFSPLPRMVRDTAATLGKSVTLTLEGSDVELDREMIELLRDPLVHMVRNAIDHGIEARSDRVLAGKPAAGRLRIGARQAGNLIVVEISDDGRGIDIERLADKIVTADPTRAAAVRAMSETQRLELIFEPGLSSRDNVTTVSGRGVGMDVVKANVEQIGGRISLASRRGEGLTVTIEVPLTLAILNAIVVEAGGTRFAIARQAVEEIVPYDAAAMTRFDAGAMVRVRERRLPLVLLEDLVDVKGAPPRYLALLSVRHGTFAVPIAGICDMQELVVKPAAPAVMRAGIYAGQMLPDDGVPILLLDVAAIAVRAGLSFATVREQRRAEATAPGIQMLLVDALDGAARLVPAEAIARVEQVEAGAVRRVDGSWWLTRDGVPTRVAAPAGVDPAAAALVLRLTLDAAEIAYPVAAVHEIVELAGAPTVGEDGIAVAVIADEPIAVLDLLALFDAVLAARQRPVCLLQGSEGAWMQTFLGPTIEAAGYRVARKLAPGERAAATLAMADEDPPVASADANVIRLGRHPGEGVYRYDRRALVSALTERRA